MLAAGLRKVLNVGDHDVVLMFSENSIWYPIVMLGTICAGGIFTGANPGYTCSEAELVHQLKVSGSKCIFTDRERLAIALQATQAVGLPLSSLLLVDSEDDDKMADIPTLSSLLVHGSHSWKTASKADSLTDRPVVLNFSSGTTGLPKACCITHGNLVANSEQTLHLDRMARAQRGDPAYAVNDVHCAFLPLYHAMGILTYCVVNVKRYSTTVIMPRFDLKELLRSIQSFKVTNLLLVPPVVSMLVNSALVSQFDLSSVKFLICGAAPLQRELELQLETIFSKTGARSRQGWGMSEATMAVTLFGPDEFDPFHESVGYLVPNMQIKIIKEDGQCAIYGEEGEAIIRGPNVFKGYYKNDAATKETFTGDGWLITGDIVRISKTGLVSVVDRKKELIKVKGFQVAPSELEGHLLQHPGVQDCAVIRVLRVNGHEQPQAHVIRRQPDVTTESILAFMDKRLSAHKRITGGVIFTDVIPKSRSGKILRRMLKDGHASSDTRSRL
ncbi:Ff.00g064420.m01.CDS01 [Fusarium sp. VM40]|nr:Ff.00g064420.m01.CDS01 [Fusarium sp. VM40]